SLAVQQALINLLVNAIKFAPEKTVITVRLSLPDSKHWELSVADQGPGIPEEEKRNVFERFYRLGSELRRETQGAGIGLSIVKHIAEGHGGSVTIENQSGGGAKFILVLPLLPAGAHLESHVSCLAS
ncbi:MAG: ATP-binding protein, partial [Verrucomicrobiaceae bacterium]